MKTELQILRILAKHYADNGYSKAIDALKEIEELNNEPLSKKICNVTPALSQADCGTTCCTPLPEKPKKLSLRSSFAVHLADFKASWNK